MNIEEIQMLSLLVNILNMILWSIYVIYTILTFKQIKKQTDISSQAHINVATIIDVYNPEELSKIDQAIKKLHGKWKEIIGKNYPNAIQADKLIYLRLKNLGKSAVVEWTISVDVVVKPGNALAMNANTTGEYLTIEIKSRNHPNTLIKENSDIIWPIGILGNFPQVKYLWELEYKDANSSEISIFTGEHSYEAKNLFCFPSQETNYFQEHVPYDDEVQQNYHDNKNNHSPNLSAKNPKKRSKNK